MRGFSVALQWLYSGSTMNKRRCELHGQIEKRGTMNEGMTNNERTNDEQMTNK